MRSAGLLARAPRYYAWKTPFTLLLWALGVAALIFFRQHFVLVLIDAVYLGFAYGQVALLGHDIGHGQVCREGRRKGFLQFLCGGLVGISPADWVEQHNEHHLHPNHEDMDPDIQIPILAYTPEQAREKQGLYRLIVRYQGWLFFPIIVTLVSLTLRKNGFVYAATRRLSEGWKEWAILIGHIGCYLAIVFAVLPVPWAIAFIALHQSSFGFYMGTIFAPNHKGMHIVRRGETIDYLREQVLTARNVRPGLLTDFLYGGLNYQIEHHLFPAMPRCHFRAANAIVKHFLGVKAVPYHETGIVQSYREILRSLHEVGLTLKRAAS